LNQVTRSLTDVEFEHIVARHLRRDQGKFNVKALSRIYIVGKAQRPSSKMIIFPSLESQ
jgi:hypothetical protein